MTTSNPLQGTVTITLDRDYTLKLSFNAMVMAEELAGIDLAKMDIGGHGLKGVRAVLFASLVHGMIADGSAKSVPAAQLKLPSLEQLGEVIQTTGYTYCLKRLVAARDAAFKNEAEDAPADPNAQPTTVSGSASPDAGVPPAASASAPATSGS